MLINRTITKALQSLSRIAPGAYCRGQLASMYSTPDLLVREALWRIAHPNNDLWGVASHDRDDVLQFLSFAAPLMHTSASQFFQDLWARWETDSKLGGYFVEFGATDGKILSNTYMLEKQMAWSGIVAEPHPGFAAELIANRSCGISRQLVHSSSGQKLDFTLAETPSYSHIGKGAGSIEIKTISLNDLLLKFDAPREIDFLSVDTEGSEFDILSSFDFDRWRVRCIAVEHNHTGNRGKLFDLLTARGFRRKWPFIGHVDDWYVSERS